MRYTALAGDQGYPAGRKGGRSRRGRYPRGSREPMTDTLYRGCPPAYTAVGGSLEEEDSAEEELEPDAAEELDGDPQTVFLP